MSKSQLKKIRVLLTGGGTGGHIYPLTAVAEALQGQIAGMGHEADIRYFGGPKEYRGILEKIGVKIVYITPSKWRRYFDIKNFFDVFFFIGSVIQGLWKIFWFMPNVCFSKGGPGAFSVVAVCRFYTIPIVIHESDAIPGLTTKLSSKFARLIEIAFTDAISYLPVEKTHLVGNPVRDELLNPDEVKAAKIQFGFDSNDPVVLFLCGSQGAEKINDFVLENIEALTEKFQILHQTGPRNYTSHAQQYDFLSGRFLDRVKARYKFFPFFTNDLLSAYTAADVVVSRSGAGVVFELAAIGKASILVPLPTSANNHQVQNAYQYEKSGASIVIEEENLLIALLIREIEGVLSNAEKRKSMEEAAKKFYIPDSANLIAKDLLEISEALR